MAINNGCVPFTNALISQAPDASGVFALWQDGAVVYYGKASSGAATIRSALDGHLKGRSFNSEKPTRCSWEVADNPELRHAELLIEFENAHQRMPRWNDPERLPT